MLRQIDYRQFAGWMAFVDLEPLERDTYQLAQIAQILYNVNRDSKKDPQGKGMMDFVIGDVDRPKPPPQSVEYMQMVIEGWIVGSNAIHKGKTR